MKGHLGQDNSPQSGGELKRGGDKDPDLFHFLLSELLLVNLMIPNQPNPEGKGTWKTQFIEDSTLGHSRTQKGED